MPTTIYKYELTIGDMNSFDMPKGARVLCVQTQGVKPCLWVQVDLPIADTETRLFCVVGTGHESIHCDGPYVGTYQLHGGQLVFHVFEIAPRECYEVHGS